MGFERGGSRGRSSPAWGDTRGLAPSVGARATSATSNALPLRHTKLRARSSMDRAPDYGSGGYRFKSCRARHPRIWAYHIQSCRARQMTLPTPFPSTQLTRRSPARGVCCGYPEEHGHDPPSVPLPSSAWATPPVHRQSPSPLRVLPASDRGLPASASGADTACIETDDSGQAEDIRSGGRSAACRTARERQALGKKAVGSKRKEDGWVDRKKTNQET